MEDELTVGSGGLVVLVRHLHLHGLAARVRLDPAELREEVDLLLGRNLAAANEEQSVLGKETAKLVALFPAERSVRVEVQLRAEGLG